MATAHSGCGRKGKGIMVGWMRSANIEHGKFVEAIGWAKEIAAYAEKSYG